MPFCTHERIPMVRSHNPEASERGNEPLGFACIRGPSPRHNACETNSRGRNVCWCACDGRGRSRRQWQHGQGWTWPSVSEEGCVNRRRWSVVVSGALGVGFASLVVGSGEWVMAGGVGDGGGWCGWSGWARSRERRCIIGVQMLRLRPLAGLHTMGFLSHYRP